MGRPREFDEAFVLDQAVDTFWKSGFEATCVQELCAAMGLNPGSLYASFGDKRALFFMALDRYVDTVSRQAIERIDRGQSGLGGIRDYFEHLISAMLDGKRRWGCLITNTVAEIAAHDPEVAVRVKGHLARIEAAFANALKRAQASGELREGVGQHGAAYLVCVVQGLNILAKTKPERRVLEGLVTLAIDTLGTSRAPQQQTASSASANNAK